MSQDVYPWKAWQFNKIREVLKRKYNTHGYPLKKGHHIEFSSGVGLWVPDFWVVAHSYTRKMWELHPRRYEFKTVWIHRILRSPEEVMSEMMANNGYDKSNLLELGRLAISELTELIPGGQIVDMIDKIILMVRSLRPFPVYENISFYGTLNDYMIYQNIVHVKNDMKDMGYQIVGTIKNHWINYGAKMQELGRPNYLMEKANELYPEDFDFLTMQNPDDDPGQIHPIDDPDIPQVEIPDDDNDNQGSGGGISDPYGPPGGLF